MNQLTDLPEAIQWSEGMLLSPQHMQQQDIYWQRQLRYQLSLLQPNAWGVIDLACDEAALGKRLLRITRLNAVTHDGLVVQFPAKHEGTLELDLAQAEWPQQGALRISLAVPVRDKGAATPGSAIQRFDPVPGELENDETFPESRVEVARLRPRLSLIAGSVPPRYAAVPLLEIERDASGSLLLGRYHPPCLRLAAADFLGDQHLTRRMQALVSAMRAKIRDLAGGRRVEDNAARLDQEAKRALFVARHLAMALPAFELLLGDSTTHPHALYLELGRMTGLMAALTVNPTPPILAAYRHDDSLPGFDELLDFLEERLTLVNPLFEAMLFERESDTRFTRYLPEGTDGDGIVIELRPRKGQNTESLVEWIGQATIGSADLVQQLTMRRMAGASRSPLEASDVHGLNVSDGALLFQLRNAVLEEGDQRLPVIQPGARLVIQGMGDKFGPIDIVLHHALSVPADEGQANDE